MAKETGGKLATIQNATGLKVNISLTRKMEQVHLHGKVEISIMETI